MTLTTQQCNGGHVCRNQSNEMSNGGTLRESTFSLETTADESRIPPHPLGVKPLGNRYLSVASNARDSLGTLQGLPDEVLMILLEYLDRQSLIAVGYTCKFAFAFSAADELWKALFLESRRGRGGSLSWRGLWRSSLLSLPEEKVAKINCGNVFSDVLHRPFACSQIDLNRFAKSIPVSNQIRRLENVSYEVFAAKWSDTPFVLTDCIQEWPVMTQWSLETLLKRYPEVSFRAEAVDWPFATYSSYLCHNQDESPLYLFDRKFADKMKIEVGRGENASYWKPDCFGLDLFEVLGPERPAHRWLIIGPERSGSTFHKDPNGTSAWNAVIQGAKYWIMFPPSVAVPGVYVSKDKSEVTSPLSIAEWLLEFHAEARQLPECVEGICMAGEILHVPSGWWHLVVNMEEGIALTQNFVPISHLADVLSFLRDRPDQVTGFEKGVKDPYSLFEERLKGEYPDLLRAAQDELDRKSRRLNKRTWDAAIGATGHDENDPVADRGSRPFTFGFGYGSEDEEGE